MRKRSFWATARWNAGLIYPINKSNNKANHKSKDRITKAFKELLLSETFLPIIQIKHFFNFFKLCSNFARQSKMLAILYLHRFIIIFNLILQQCFLLLNWKKLKLFVHKCPVSLFHLLCITTIRYGKRAFDEHLHLLLACYIFLREILQTESIILLHFEGMKVIWKMFVKGIKTISFSSRNIASSLMKCTGTSNVRMFRYHVIKMNEV